jgi:SWI/SNF-related matrix-associated actin-dependent regulator of chromatin subfamily A member 5
VGQRTNGIAATTREPAGPEDTPEKLEEERQAAQDFIDNGELILYLDGLMVIGNVHL